MKRLFIAFLLILLASPAFAQTKKYGRDCARSTDCSRSMDNIACTSLNTGDRCEIIDSNRVIGHYRYNAASTDSEDFPNVIVPNDSAASCSDTGRWELYRGDISGNIQFSVSDPENLPTQTAGGRGTKSIFVWYNDTGLTLNIEEIFAISDVDDYGFKLYKSASRTNIGSGGDTPIDSVQTTLGAVGQGYYVQLTSGFDSGTIEAGKFLIFEHDTGVGVGCQAVHVYIKGYLN